MTMDLPARTPSSFEHMALMNYLFKKEPLSSALDAFHDIVIEADETTDHTLKN